MNAAMDWLFWGGCIWAALLIGTLILLELRRK